MLKQGHWITCKVLPVQTYLNPKTAPTKTTDTKEVSDLIKQLTYTKACIDVVGGTPKTRSAEIDYVKSLLVLQNLLDFSKNSSLKWMVFDSLLCTLREATRTKPTFTEYQKIVASTQIAVTQMTDTMSTSQMRRVLRKNDLHYSLGQQWYVRHYIEEINNSPIPDNIQTKSDVDIYHLKFHQFKWIKDQLKTNPELTDLSTYIPVIKANLKWLTFVLNTLTGNLARYSKSIKRQSFCRLASTSEHSEALVLCQASSDHLQRNEDAFKHTEDVTVVADGAGGHLYSKGMARLVVDCLHIRLTELVHDKQGKPIDPHAIQQQLLCIMEESATEIQKDLLILNSATAATAEVRICDDKGLTHRFLVFVGDSDAVLTRPDNKRPVLLNPTQYSLFENMRNCYDGVKRCGLDDTLFYTLTLEDILYLDQHSSNATRNSTFLKGSFSRNPDVTLMRPDALVMVYLQPGSGDTILVSDGVTDRIFPDDIGPRAVYRSIMMEGVINDYYANSQSDIDWNHTYGILKYLKSNKFKLPPLYTPDERTTIQAFKSDLHQWFAHNKEYSTLKELVTRFVDNMMWPDTTRVKYELHRFCVQCFIGASPITSQTLSHLTLAIILDRFKLSELGYKDPSKWADDITHVATNAPPSESDDLYTCDSLLFAAVRLTRIGDTLKDDDILKMLQQIHSGYILGCLQLQTGAKPVGNEGMILTYIIDKLTEAMKLHFKVKEVVIDILLDGDRHPNLRAFFSSLFDVK